MSDPSSAPRPSPPLHSLLVSGGDLYPEHGTDAVTRHLRQLRQLRAQLRQALGMQSKWHGLPSLLDELDRLRRQHAAPPAPER